MDRAGADAGHHADRLPRWRLISVRRLPAEPDHLPQRRRQHEGGDRSAPRRRHPRRAAHLRDVHEQVVPVGHAGSRSAVGQRRHVHAGCRPTRRRQGRSGCRIDQGHVYHHRLLCAQQRHAAGRRRADHLRRPVEGPALRFHPVHPRRLRNDRGGAQAGRQGAAPARVLWPVLPGWRLDPLHGGSREDGGAVQRSWVRHDLPGCAGRRRHGGGPGELLALRVEVHLGDLEAAEEACHHGDEHLPPSPVVRPVTHGRVGPPDPQPQEVHRRSLSGERRAQAPVPARPPRMVVVQDVAGRLRRADVPRRHRVPVRQGAGERHRLLRHGYRPEHRQQDPRAAAAGGDHPAV